MATKATSRFGSLLLPLRGYRFVVNRDKRFDPTPFLLRDSSVVSEDQRALRLTEIDLDTVSFETCLKPGEEAITGEEKYRRHIAAGHVLADAQIGLMLYQEEGQKTLEYLYRNGIHDFELLGTRLMYSREDCDRVCILGLFRDIDRWHWEYFFLDYLPYRQRPSLVLAGV